MDSMACTEDVLRVIPDEDKIRPGYLYAFLSGKFGVPLVTSSTYGAIIQHIEPPHLANLPVPRFGDRIEQAAHGLIEQAAQARSLASRKIAAADSAFVRCLGLPDLAARSVSQKSTSVVKFSKLNGRLDGQYHSAAALEVDAAFRAGKFKQCRLSGVLERYFKPSIFKRIWVDDASYGAQFISGSDAYRSKEDEPRYVSFSTPNFEDFILKKGMVIFQAAGQISGLFGRPLLVSGWLDGIFAADDLYRLVPKTLEDGGYLYGFFRTPHGQVALKRQASGNSIPRVWDPHIRDIFIPWPDHEVRAELASEYISAHQLLDTARNSENEAVSLVERTIEEAALWRR
jgi:type I restriction enzyme S subunit